MADYYRLPLGDQAPELVSAVVEIPKESPNKYEYDPVLGVFKLDRTLYSPLHYPGDYGFLPRTLAEDGDALDVLILTGHPTFTGCVVEARPIGALEMADDKGRDVKIIAVPVRNPRYEEYRDLFDVPNHTVRELEYFFRIYKELEGKQTDVGEWWRRRRAYDEIIACQERFDKSEKSA